MTASVIGSSLRPPVVAAVDPSVCAPVVAVTETALTAPGVIVFRSTPAPWAAAENWRIAGHAAVVLIPRILEPTHAEP